VVIHVGLAALVFMPLFCPSQGLSASNMTSRNLVFDISRIDSSPYKLNKIDVELQTKGKVGLLDPLKKAATPPSIPSAPPQLPGWFWTLKDLRNQGVHRELIKLQVAVGGPSNIFRLVTKPQTNLEIIPYLEDSLSQTRNLVENIINSEPLLKM
jgi:hypothetical protein